MASQQPTDFVSKWAHWLVPADLSRSRRRQARLILGTALGLASVVFAGLLLRLAIGDVTPTALAIIGGFSLVLASVPAWLRRGAIEVAGVVTSTAFLAVVLGSGWSSGGLQAPVFLLLPAVPLLATFLIGPQAGLYTTSMLLAFVVVLAFLGPLEPYDAPWRTSAANDVLSRALMCGLSLLVVGFFAAATEQQRRRSESRRRSSYGLYRRIFKQSKDVIAISTPSGRIIDANQAGFDLYGFVSPRDLTDFDFRSLYVDPAERDELRRRVEKDGFVRDFECRHRTLGGRLILVQVTTSAIRNVDGAITHWLSTVRDITRARHLEAERDRVIEELERKNTELEHFAHRVSHDLKSPLFTLRGFLELLGERGDQADVGRSSQGLSGELEEMVPTLLSTADRMGVLVDDLLEHARLGHDAVTPRTVSMVELAHQVVEDLSGRLNSGSVDVEIAPEMPSSFGDPTLVRTLLQNLIENAIKFTVAVNQPRIRIDALVESGQVIYRVSDNGPGIAVEDRERVFGLFVRREAGAVGSGLGLAAVEKVARLHSGRAWVGDGLLGGATVCFTLSTLSLSDDVSATLGVGGRI